MKTAAFCSLSILSGFDAWTLVGKMISFTVMKEKIDKTAAIRYKFDAMLKPSASSWLAQVGASLLQKKERLWGSGDEKVTSNILSPRFLRWNVTLLTCARKRSRKNHWVSRFAPEFQNCSMFSWSFFRFYRKLRTTAVEIHPMWYFLVKNDELPSWRSTRTRCSWRPSTESFSRHGKAWEI